MRGHAQRLHQMYVFFVEMVGVVGYIAGLAVIGFTRRVRKRVPDRGSAPIVLRSAFNLVGSGRASPQEALGVAERCRFTQCKPWKRSTGVGSSRGRGHALTKLSTSEVLHAFDPFLIPQKVAEWSAKTF